MGSIAALRSEAMAMRAKADTEVQVSSYLGSVNKGLGTQINGMIDQLQSVINSRTKAYNGAVANLKKSFEYKNGICESMTVNAIAAVSKFVQMIFDYTSVFSMSTLFSAIGGAFTAASMAEKIRADVYNYEKMVSQLGFTQVDPAPVDPLTGSNKTIANMSDAGTYTLLQKRDSLSPRYKSKDKNWLASSNASYLGGGVSANNNNGYVGTLRRV